MNYCRTRHSRGVTHLSRKCTTGIVGGGGGISRDTGTPVEGPFGQGVTVETGGVPMTESRGPGAPVKSEGRIQSVGRPLSPPDINSPRDWSR